MHNKVKTNEEMITLFEEVIDYIYKNNNRWYHNWYLPSDVYIFSDNGTYLMFEVYVRNDKWEGDDWTEIWYINDNGSIQTEDEKYENVEEFKRLW